MAWHQKQLKQLRSDVCVVYRIRTLLPRKQLLVCSFQNIHLSFRGIKHSASVQHKVLPLSIKVFYIVRWKPCLLLPLEFLCDLLLFVNNGGLCLTLNSCGESLVFWFPLCMFRYCLLVFTQFLAPRMEFTFFLVTYYLGQNEHYLQQH